MKLVINKCYGGFGLSDAACERLIELGLPRVPWNNEEHGVAVADTQHPESLRGETFNAERFSKLIGQRYYAGFARYEHHRSHPLVVQVVEELGPRANGQLAKLKVVEIPDGVEFEIDEYDGIESVREQARSWG